MQHITRHPDGNTVLYLQLIAVDRQKGAQASFLVAVNVRAVRPAALGLAAVARHPDPDVRLALVSPKLHVHMCSRANQTCVFVPSSRSTQLGAFESAPQRGSASSCWG